MSSVVGRSMFLCMLMLKIALSDARLLQRQEYKMCVPEDLYDLCTVMASQETKSSVKIICVAARDRMECIEKIKKREADFLTVDPEDMYVAKNTPEEDFVVFEEIRTKEEPEAEFRYEAVAVIHKDLNISNIQDLKGLNSCHTGVGRNVGYKIPLTKLQKKGIIGNLAQPDLSPRENELKALSDLFNQACIVGKWSPDPKINLKLKRKYANLCALCERPEVCDYPDLYSGYDGALRCLAHHGGQIAWTKVIFVRKFFGLPVGINPGSNDTKEDSSQFAYLCPDATKVSITDTPCTWAARPWQGYMTNAAVAKSAEELRRKIENLANVGSKNHASWWQKILELNDKTIPKENKAISPGTYLDKANYTDVVERDYGPPFKVLRFCVTSQEEENKCHTLSAAAFSRNIRPRFDCVLEKSVFDCLKSVQDNGADVITLDGGLVDVAMKKYNLKPILEEQYGNRGTYYAVAVIRKNSTIQSFEDLRGKKSCHTGIGRTAGYNAPLYTLLSKGLIQKTDCPYPKALSKFFDSSCLPGSKDPKWNLDEPIAEKLCSLCSGDLEKKEISSKCNFDQSESFSGYTGAFRCLIEAGGDVAFVKHVTVPGNTDGKNNESWAKDLKSGDFELLCSDGGRASVTEFDRCHLAHAPPHMVVTSNDKSDSVVDEIRNALLSASEQFTERSDLFKLFGSFNGKKDLLFKDSSTGLVSISARTSEVRKQYNDLLQVINGCN
ncbi:hypothetical protein ABEB36_015392 [Hypothenemus hampei]|uniref:Transferrin n=1 Tax=Hypothenemus hampei TaxID=57062 RepID=A0ABD1E029_HYPHA